MSRSGRGHLSGWGDGVEALRPLVDTALDAVAKGVVQREGPAPAATPNEVRADVRSAMDGEALPENGRGASHALRSMVETFVRHSVDPSDPFCAAHLHCPSLAVAVAADLVASSTNGSLDSWDQAPSGIALEVEMVRALAEVVGYDPQVAAGVMTTGGTESNLMGLLLAREHIVRKQWGVDVVKSGVPADASGRLRVFCSELAHFSVARNLGVLGLGEGAVVAVPVDAHQRLDIAALERLVADAADRGDVPMAIVATAGTTDYGSIDDVDACAAVAADVGAWFHIDAAYGGGALFSHRLRPMLGDVAKADSVALDFHKLGWQPAAAGVFLSRASTSFAPIDRSVAYLNPSDDEDAGMASLLGRSLRTTRRADVLKLAVTFQAMGRQGFGEMVDRCHLLTKYAAGAIDRHPRLERVSEPVLTTIVFRYVPRHTADSDRVNASLRRRLFISGRAVVGRSDVAPEVGPEGSLPTVRLKLTLLNHETTHDDIDELLARIVAAGEGEDVQ